MDAQRRRTHCYNLCHSRRRLCVVYVWLGYKLQTQSPHNILLCKPQNSICLLNKWADTVFWVYRAGEISSCSSQLAERKIIYTPILIIIFRQINRPQRWCMANRYDMTWDIIRLNYDIDWAYVTIFGTCSRRPILSHNDLQLYVPLIWLPIGDIGRMVHSQVNVKLVSIGLSSWLMCSTYRNTKRAHL